MDVIINANKKSLPEKVTPIPNQGHCYLNLLSSLGYPDDKLPMANLLARQEGLSGDWLVVSPIHWEATHNDAMITLCGGDLLLEADSREWFQYFADALEKEGLKLYYAEPFFWLLSKDSLPTLAAKSVYQMLHQSMMPILSAMDDTLFWQRFITESQMLLSACPLNEARSEQQKPSINGVWVWGEGELQEGSQAICADSLLAPVARLCSNRVRFYNYDISLKSCDHLLLNQPQQISKKHWKQLQGKSVRWMWNDKSYTSRPNWWQTFWRSITHAH